MANVRLSISCPPEYAEAFRAFAELEDGNLSAAFRALIEDNPITAMLLQSPSQASSGEAT